MNRYTELLTQVSRYRSQLELHFENAFDISISRKERDKARAGIRSCFRKIEDVLQKMKEI